MSTIMLSVLLSLGSEPMDAKSARALLREKGLSRSGLTYVLEGERELKSGLRELTQLRKNLEKAAQERDEWQRWIAARRWERAAGAAELERLSHLLARADDVDDHNEVVMRINAVKTRLNAINAQIENAGNNERIPGQVALARTQLQDKVALLREIAQQVVRDSTMLANDPQVSSALDALNADGRKKYAIGPSKRFHRDVERLSEYENVVLEERIKLRPNNGTYLIDTVINGKHPKTMILDTGASLVLLTESAARSAGVRFDSRTELGFAKVADGRIVPVRRILLDSITVGGFTIRQVECAVIPDQQSKVDALLGGAFLDHFTYTVDPDANVLTLTRDNVGSSGKSRKSR